MLVQSSALFDARSGADRVVDTLEQEGFETIVIDAEWTRVGAEKLDAGDLVHLGVASRQAARFADRIHGGATLVVISCDETRLADLRDSMARFDMRAPDDIPPSGHLLFVHRSGDELEGTEPIEEGGIHRNPAVQRQYRRADSERMVGEHDSGSATGLSRRAHSEGTAPGPDAEPAESPDRQGPEAVASSPPMLDRFETSFRHHYDNNFADTELPYSHYARAYHYGVVLAEHRGFRDRDWQDIEAFARQGWASQIHGDWEAVKDAVHYGWNTLLGSGSGSAARR